MGVRLGKGKEKEKGCLRDHKWVEESAECESVDCRV